MKWSQQKGNLYSSSLPFFRHLVQRSLYTKLGLEQESPKPHETCPMKCINHPGLHFPRVNIREVPHVLQEHNSLYTLCTSCGLWTDDVWILTTILSDNKHQSLNQFSASAMGHFASSIHTSAKTDLQVQKLINILTHKTQGLST